MIILRISDFANLREGSLGCCPDPRNGCHRQKGSPMENRFTLISYNPELIESCSS